MPFLITITTTSLQKFNNFSSLILTLEIGEGGKGGQERVALGRTIVRKL